MDRFCLLGWMIYNRANCTNIALLLIISSTGTALLLISRSQVKRLKLIVETNISISTENRKVWSVYMKTRASCRGRLRSIRRYILGGAIPSGNPHMTKKYNGKKEMSVSADRYTGRWRRVKCQGLQRSWMRYGSNTSGSHHTHIWMSLVTYMNGSSPISEWIMSQTWMFPVTYIHDSCRTHEGGTAHT